MGLVGGRTPRYPDPGNASQERFWNGMAWTSEVRARGAVYRKAEERARSASYRSGGLPYPRNREGTSALTIAFGIILALVVFPLLLIGGCGALFVGSVEHAGKEREQKAAKKYDRGLTNDQAKQVQRGMSETQVRRLLGKPYQVAHEEGETILFYYQRGKPTAPWNDYQATLKHGKVVDPPCSLGC